MIDPKTGKKFGKTESGKTIWLDRVKTPPFEFYQFLLISQTNLFQLLLGFFFKRFKRIEKVRKQMAKK